MSRAGLGGRFPAPAVIVLADNVLAITGDPGSSVVALAAEFTGFVALATVSQRSAPGWRERRRRSRDEQCSGDREGGKYVFHADYCCLYSNPVLRKRAYSHGAPSCCDQTGCP